MVQLRILSGKMAGEIIHVRHFPFGIGRAPHNDLCFDEAGVWDSHFDLKFQRREGFILKAAPGAFCAVNEEPQNSVRLRNGDVISFGSAKMQFWLAPAKQRGLQLGELFFWLLLVGLTFAQIIMLLKLRR